MKALFTECKEGDLEFYPSALQGIEVEATTLSLKEIHPDPETSVLSVMVHSPVGEVEMEQLPKLRLITTRSTGFDHIDLITASKKGIVVCNIPDYGSRTIAEHTILLLLAIMRRLPAARAPIESGRFSLEGLLGFDMFGKTLGVVGTGLIGGEVARMARCLGLRTIGFDPQPIPGKVDQYVTLEALLSESDAIAICCPLNPQTRHMIGREEFRKMKRGVFIVNTARGAIIDSSALLNALESGHVACAGLDVLEREDLMRIGANALNQYSMTEEEKAIVSINLRLMKHPNVLVTPHMAFYTQEARQRIRTQTVENILSFLKGKPIRVVNQ
ncbi:MAG: hypothetical protein KIT74_08715 [Fimbriimonadales bacterium]|nr:hypothetical protein [Fimbriimonadales bacterium]